MPTPDQIAAKYGGTVVADPDAIAAKYGGMSVSQQQPGVFQRLGETFGVPQSMQELKGAAPQSVSDAVDMLTPGGIATKLIQNYVNTAGQGLKQGYQEAGEADQLRKQGLISTPQAIGKTASAALNATVNAIPVIGPSMVSMGEDVSRKNYRGATGTGLGIAAQVLAPELMKRAGEAIPSKARAGAAFNEVKAAAGSVPLDTSKLGDTALQLYTQSQRGATLPKVARDLVNRLTKPGSEPITYAEGKDFQSNISRLSANENMNLNANTQRLLGQLNADLKDSLQSAAQTAGRGAQFSSAMKEYRQASQIGNIGTSIKNNVVPAAIKGAAGALGAGSLTGLGYYLWKNYLGK